MELPSFLQKSALYNNLDKDEIISVPLDMLIDQINLHTFEDLCKILNILRYWIVEDCPHEIFYYVLHHKKDINIQKLIKYY